jgi:hypothetical protein
MVNKLEVIQKMNKIDELLLNPTKSNSKTIKKTFEKSLIVATHKKPHIDEMTGILEYILWKTKENESVKAFLKTINSIEFWFVNAGEKYDFNANTVLFGTGKGNYDEHKKFFDGKYFNADRIPGYCSATLVAKYLSKNEGFKPILENLQEFLNYVLNQDSKGRGNPMDVADFINSLKHNETDKELMKIGLKILYSFYMINSLPSQDDRDKTADFLENWLRRKDQIIAKPIINFAKGLRHGNRLPYDLTQIQYSMDKTYGTKEANETIEKLLEAKYLAQQKFIEAIKELEKKSLTDFIMRGKEILKIITIKSGNWQIPKAARKEKSGPGAAWLNMKTNDKKFLALHSKKFNFTYEIKNIIASLRLEEQLVRKKTNPVIDFKKLSGPGSFNIPDVGDIWYFQKEDRGGKIFNGTNSRNIEETKIPLERIREITYAILKLGRNFRWNVWIQKNF